MTEVIVNLLAKDLANALEVNDILKGDCLIGLMCKDYSNQEIIERINEYNAALNGNVSLGLGAGNPEYGERVIQLSNEVEVKHINQVFPFCGQTKANALGGDTIINALISPSGNVNSVIINTGPQSSKLPNVEIDMKAAVILAKEMGANSLKFYPMNGLKHIKEFENLCKIAADYDMVVEPTGGINLTNFEEICSIAIKCNVKKVIPHVYTSIMDDTGLTKLEDVKKIDSIKMTLTNRS